MGTASILFLNSLLQGSMLQKHSARPCKQREEGIQIGQVGQESWKYPWFWPRQRSEMPGRHSGSLPWSLKIFLSLFIQIK